MKKLLNYICDTELKTKPNSIKIRNEIIKDFARVDSSKWQHPKLPNGETRDSYGTIEYINGQLVTKPADFDIYSHEHPDLDYKFFYYPSGRAFKEGQEGQTTDKDAKIITSAFYRSKDGSKFKMFLSDWYCIWYKSKDFILCSIILGIFLAIASFLFISYTIPSLIGLGVALILIMFAAVIDDFINYIVKKFKG